ncbi:dual specificity protein phosphatase 15 isoform X2 [Cervus canadensis]|uniref:dual specificity protein phosphatase 15 isoform X2 n=1 Tax=Cervus canadensis TaxID=1574408 RepID=UPI001C9E668C|nr:dual specificity protein phosphatase 15 isoform X2 [Cervus canadensis]
MEWRRGDRPAAGDWEEDGWRNLKIRGPLAIQIQPPSRFYQKTEEAEEARRFAPGPHREGRAEPELGSVSLGPAAGGLSPPPSAALPSPSLTVPGRGERPHPPPPEVEAPRGPNKLSLSRGPRARHTGALSSPPPRPTGGEGGGPHDRGGRRSLWRRRRRRLGRAGPSCGRRAPRSPPGCRRRARAVRAAVTLAFSGWRAGGAPGTPSPGSWGMVLPGLYLGNFIDAKDTDQLGRNKITHIISIHESPQPLLQDITYLRISVADAPEVPMCSDCRPQRGGTPPAHFLERSR